MTAHQSSCTNARVFGFALFVVLSAGCGRTLQTRTLAPGELVTQPGLYVSPNSPGLRVTVGPHDSIVRFEILGTDRQTVIGRGDAGSNVMRWALCFEGNDMLWVYSSDIGTFLWKSDPERGFLKVHPSYDAAFIRQIPQRLYDFHASSIRKDWDVHRQGAVPAN